MANRYTKPPEEIARIERIVRDMYPWYSRDAILLALPGYTWSGIREIASRLGVRRMVGRWQLPIDEQTQGGCYVNEIESCRPEH